MERPKISVIVPVYNTEKYVYAAVKSIQEQTLKELEIIIIIDGSTDDSLSIVTGMAAGDERIQIHHQKNQGQSIARNNGVEHATGYYVYFMDSDDLLEPDALDLCYDKCEDEGLDFVFFDAVSFIDPGSPPGTRKLETAALSYKHTRNLEDKVYKGVDVLNLQLEQHQYTPSVCLNMICRDYLDDYRLRFYPHILHEDQLYTALLYVRAQRVGFISRSFFLRRLRSDSIMTTRFNMNNAEGYLTVARVLARVHKKHPNPDIKQAVNMLLSQMLDAAVWQAHVMPLIDRITLFGICLARYKRYVRTRTLATLLLKKKKKQ